jgi:hypothetical protein
MSRGDGAPAAPLLGATPRQLSEPTGQAAFRDAGADEGGHLKLLESMLKVCANRVRRQPRLPRNFLVRVRRRVPLVEPPFRVGSSA